MPCQKRRGVALTRNATSDSQVGPRQYKHPARIKCVEYGMNSSECGCRKLQGLGRQLHAAPAGSKLERTLKPRMANDKLRTARECQFPMYPVGKCTAQATDSDGHCCTRVPHGAGDRKSVG